MSYNKPNYIKFNLFFISQRVYSEMDMSYNKSNYIMFNLFWALHK